MTKDLKKFMDWRSKNTCKKKLQNIEATIDRLLAGTMLKRQKTVSTKFYRKTLENLKEGL